jgi:transposase
MAGRGGQRGVAMARDLPPRRCGWIGGQAGARPAAETDPPQRQRLPQLLAVGAQHYGYSNDLWTTRRMAVVIQRELQVDYHPAQVSRILHDLGWSYQQPERRAVERNQAALDHWQRSRWVEIKKARRLRAYLALLDESGLLLAPTVLGMVFFVPICRKPQVARGLVSRACYGDPAGVADNANWFWSVPPDNAILSISSIRVMANRNGASEITTEP